jgi:hypothetical protein
MEKSASEMADSVSAKAKLKLAQIDESAMVLANSIKSIIAQEISAKVVNEQLNKLKMLKKAALNAGLKV